MKVKPILLTVIISLALLLTALWFLGDHSRSVYARPLRSIEGSSVMPDHTDYYSDASNVYSLTVFNASTDAERLDEVKVVFPESWNVTGAQGDSEDSSGNPVNFDVSGIGAHQLLFQDADGEWGEITEGHSWRAIVTVTAPIMATGEQTVTWSLSGDGAGAAPHDITDTFTLSPPQITPLTSVTITGTNADCAYVYHTFTATVAPVTATPPIHYVWQATDQVSETHENGGTSDTARFKWQVEGLKTITVTVGNASGIVSETHALTITLPDVAPEGLTLRGPTAGLPHTVYTYTASVKPVTTTQPITYVWQASNGFSRTIPGGLQQAVTVTWSITGTKIVTVTATNVADAVSETMETQITTSAAPPTVVQIRGPRLGLINAGYTFIADVGPVTSTQPITYTWQATGQDDVAHTGYLSDAASFTWIQPGVQTITVTAGNAADAVTDTHVITIGDPITAVNIEGPADGFDKTTYAFTATVSPSSTLQPITYTWQANGQDSITHTSGLSDVVEFTWNTPGTKTITVRATNVATPVFDAHTIVLKASICLTVSPKTLLFSMVEGGVAPDPQHIDIINCGSGDVDWQVKVKEAASWLVVSPTLGENTSTITASTIVSGLVIDVYEDIIQIDGRDGVQSTREYVPVTLRIGSGTIYLPLVIRNWPPTPGTPVLNAITPPGENTTYQVSWSAADRADTYILERATHSDFSDTEEVYSGSNTAHTVDSEGIARYYYRVKARNIWGDSGWSNVQSVDVFWEKEPNDDAKTQANGPLASGSTYYGLFPADDIKDYFYFDLSTAHSVELWLTNIAAGQDYDVYLRDVNLNVVDSSATAGSVDEHIFIDDLQSGRYYIQVYNYSASGSTQPYHLRVVYE